MSVKERKKEKSVWSLLFGFSEDFDETKDVLSDETYDKELKKALANIEKMEKRFEVPDIKKEKVKATKQKNIVAKPLDKTREEKSPQEQDKERE